MIKKFGTYFTLPLLVVGTAMVQEMPMYLLLNVVKSEENRRKSVRKTKLSGKLKGLIKKKKMTNRLRDLNRGIA